MNANNDIIIRAYLKLREKLLTLKDRAELPDDNKKVNSKEDIFKNLSSNHHYISKFFTDGFLDDDALLFVYDKKKNRIKLNKQGSKGVFFEINRNSTDFGFDRPISLIEEAYAVFDNIIPASIKLLRSDIELTSEMRIELHAHLNTFIIDLYWRNINNDQLFDALYDKAPLAISDSSGPVLLSAEQTRLFKDVPFMKQLMRYKMVAITLEYITKPENADKIFTANTITFPLKQLCLGDLPFLMFETPDNHNDLINAPAFIPISSTKLYLRNISLKGQMGFHETNMLNALIIEQSTKMICSGTKMVLEAAIDYYRLAKEENLFDYFRNCLFSL